jgi:hypothetical protein
VDSSQFRQVEALRRCARGAPSCDTCNMYTSALLRDPRFGGEGHIASVSSGLALGDGRAGSVAVINAVDVRQESHSNHKQRNIYISYFAFLLSVTWEACTCYCTHKQLQLQSNHSTPTDTSTRTTKRYKSLASAHFHQHQLAHFFCRQSTRTFYSREHLSARRMMCE